MGLLRSDFVRFGPSPTTMYVGIVLDTWTKWSAVAAFTAISSFMNDLAGESLEPFFLMVIRDHKTRFIPYSKPTSVVLNQMWSAYCSIMSVFGLYTYFAQADLLVIKMCVGLLVNLYSSWRYLRNKQHEPLKYMRYFQQLDTDEDNLETVGIFPTKPEPVIDPDHFMRTTTGGMRPAGSMHSYSPLVSALGCRYVIDIRQLDQIVFFNGSHVRAGAGATIESIQKHLAIYKKTFRGIGSYTGQTLAGGFSTSLAGIEMVAFSQFATWAKTVNAFGDIVEWNDLYYLRDSMGMMGVIVELEFRVFDNYDFAATVHSSSVEDLISIGASANVDAFDSITTLFSDHSSIKSVSYQRIGGPTSVRDDGAKVADSVLNLIDYFVTPLSFVIPFHNFVPLVEPNIVNKDEQLATIARDTHVFGLTFLDYRIPRSNCTAFFSSL
ncbi:hypothetical protein T484DRAFT_1757260, partial [Baffinella frigidus]